MIPIRFYLYAAALAVIVAGFLFYRHSLIAEGEAKVRAADDLAVAVAARAVEAQKQRDLKTSQFAVQGLQDELKNLRDHPPAPIVVRVCRTSSGRPPSSTPPDTSHAEPRPAPPGSVPIVPDTAADIGPGLQRLALACDTLSAEHRALLQWAREVAK